MREREREGEIEGDRQRERDIDRGSFRVSRETVVGEREGVVPRRGRDHSLQGYLAHQNTHPP